MRVGLKDDDDDPSWDMDKVLDTLKAAQSTLQAAQTKHRENHDTCLCDALEEKEKEINSLDTEIKKSAIHRK
jgi:hypothetical protein